MTRRGFLFLPLVEQAIDSCEFQAIDAWNKFAATSARYLKLREQGIRSLKERQRMEREFAEVLKSDCF